MANPKDTINVGVWVHPNSLNICKSNDVKKFSNDSIDPAVLQFLSFCLEDAGYKYKFKCIEGEINPLFEDTRVFDDILNRIRLGQLDTAALRLKYSDYRQENFDFSYPFFDSQYSFIIKTRQIAPNEGALVLIRGLSFEVWIAWLLIALIFIFALTLTKIITEYQFRRRESLLKIFSDKCWFILRYMINQNEWDISSKYKRISNKMLIIFLSYFIVIMLNVYQTVVYNQIASTAKSESFYTEQEIISLIKNKQLTLLSNYDKSTYFDYVSKSNELHFREMRQALAENPLQKTSNIKSAIDLVIDGDYAFIGNRQDASDVASVYCNVQQINLNVPSIGNGFVFNKNVSSKILKPINRAILRVIGRFDNLDDKPRRFYHQLKNEKCGGHRGVRSLSLQTLSGVFLLFLSLIALAVIIFGIEKFIRLVKSSAAAILSNDREKQEEKETQHSRVWDNSKMISYHPCRGSCCRRKKSV